MTADSPSSAQQSQPKNAMAVTSLATGIAGVTVAPLVGSVAALICGYMARKQLRAAPGRESGAGYATAGIVLGWIGAVLAVIGVIVFLAFFAFVSDKVSDFNNEVQQQEREFDRDVRQQNADFDRRAREDERRHAREAAQDQRQFERRVRETRERFERRARENRQRVERHARENRQRVPPAVPLPPVDPVPVAPQP